MAEKKPEIPMIDCRSGALRSYGYDAGTKTLAVKFKNGGSYRYSDVPQDVVDGLITAKSMGGFMHRSVVGHFKATKD